MPSKEQKKFLKKKEREQKVRKKLAILRAKADEVSRRHNLVKEIRSGLGRFNKLYKDEDMSGLSEDTLKQLRHNVEILRALEEEYETERAKKKAIHDDLESKGFTTLEEKLGYLRSLQGQTAIVPKPPPREVAEVTVQRAPEIFELS